MEIGRPYVVKDNDCVRLVADVSYSGGTTSLWYSIPAQHAGLLCEDLGDPFLVGLLPVAMRFAERVNLDGLVSERLLWHANHGLQVVLHALNPRLSVVEVSARGSMNVTSTGHGVATGFSGGVDSFAVLLDHHYQACPPSLKLTHLLFYNVGSHLAGGRELFLQRLRRIQVFADHVGLPLVPVDSNLDEFYSKAGLGFASTFTVRNVSAALVLQGGLKTYLYASGNRYQDCRVGQSRDIAIADPVLLPLLSSGRLETFGVGGEYSRVIKTLRISEIEDTYEYLEVCWKDSGINCGKCLKCIRTLVTLEIAGRLHLYERVFDLGEWRNRRALYIGRLLARRDPLVYEIRAFAKDRGYRFPVTSVVLSHGLALSSRIPRTLPILRQIAREMKLLR